MLQSRLKITSENSPEGLLEKIQKSTREKREDVMRIWSGETANLMKDAARGQHGKSKRHRKNPRGGHFWSNIASVIKDDAIDPMNWEIFVDDSASNSNDSSSTPSAMALFRHTGGQLRAKRQKSLTIPVHEDAYDRAVGDFKDAGIFRPKGKDFLAINTGKGKRQKLKVLFILRPTVTQTGRPWIPEEEEVSSLGFRVIERVGLV